MKKNIGFIEKYEKEILFTVFLFGIVGIFWTFLASFGLGESGYNFLGKTKKVTLSPGAPITQTFTAHENNLSQVRFVMSNVELQKNDFLEFRLLNKTCDSTIAMKRFRTKPNEQGAYSVFTFPTITDSKDQDYCFSVTYFSDENRKGEKPYLSAIDEPDPVFVDRTMTDTNKGKIYPSQSLFLRPAYTTGSLTEDLSRLVERLSQYKPTFLKDWRVICLFGALLIGTILLASYLTMKQDIKE